tara:strand:- start:2054 stop:2272 length:219 start_codon:yes stop_codon:yes gene_type:complete
MTNSKLTPENIDNLINNAKRKGINPIEIITKITRENKADKFIKSKADFLTYQQKKNLKKVLVDFQKFQGEDF